MGIEYFHIRYALFIFFKDFDEKPGYFCHANTNMTSTTLEDAKRECHEDESCNSFYQVCEYDRFRKCNDTAYMEDSECGELGLSDLYIKGNRNY